MCNAPIEFFVPTYDAKRISRSKLHKYLIRDKPDEKVFDEISSNRTCIYQQTKNGQSALFLALARSKESVIKKLVEIYENDFKLLQEIGYNNDLAVLIAFGLDEIAFVEEKLSKFSTEGDNTDTKNKVIILMKETNESTSSAKLLTPKTDDDQKIYLEIIERLHNNGTFDVALPNSNDDSLLSVAASQGLTWVIEKLQEFGATGFTSPNKQKNSPFDFACINNQLETVKWFHKNFKMDLLKTMMEGTSLFSIASHGSFEVFNYIMSEIKRLDGDEHVEEIFARRTDYHDCNILIQAINSGKYEFVTNCMKFDPDLNVRDSSNNSLLHVVLRAWPSNQELCKVLIKKHPNLLVMEDSNQWTPLHLLATRNFIDDVKEAYDKYPSCKNTFFKHFVDSPTIQKTKDEIWCETPGHLAFTEVIRECHYEMASFILDNHPEEFESTPYISALLIAMIERNSSIEFLEKLRKLKSFNINVPDEHNNYPLVSALKTKNFEVYDYLMKTCAVKDVNSMIEPYINFNLLNYAIWQDPFVFRGDEGLTCCMLEVDADSSDEESEAAPRSKRVAARPRAFSRPRDLSPETQAERKKMFEIFTDLVKRGVDVKRRGNGDETLLHTAVTNDNIEVVRELLKLGLKVEDVDEPGNNALHFVKSFEVFKALVETGVKPETINARGATGTPFMNFASYFSMNKVPIDFFNEFMTHNADVNGSDHEGNRALHNAQTEEWVLKLIEHGADINATNKAGENVVHLALKYNRWELARFILLNTEIDRFAVTKDEVSYLGYCTAGNMNYREVFAGELAPYFDELIEKFINGKNCYEGLIIHDFVSNNELKVIQHPKADLHQIEAGRQTSLHRAINYQNANLDEIKVLIDKGLDINAVNETGFTPLILCLDYGCSEAAQFFIEQENVNLNQANAFGWTALHYAARNEEIVVLCKLLAAGADPKVVNNENQTFYDLLKAYEKKLFSSYASLN